ncbi:MAG: hypothetical protein ABJA98_34270 [Acidobacteriota bacterium]
MTFVMKGALLLGLVAVVQGSLFFWPASRDVLNHSYYGAWRLKHELLVAPGQNRLIVVGGSNVAFSVDSTTLERALVRPTINMGLHGDVGLAHMVHEVEDGARAGDFVVLIPEYEQFYGDVLNGALPAAEVVQYDWSALRYFSSWRQWRNLATNSRTITSAATFALLDQAKGRLLRLPRENREVTTVYRSDAFDSHGDMVAHLGLESDPRRILASTVRAEGEFNEEAVDVTVRCAEALAKRGATFVIVFPAISAGYWAVNQDLAKQVATRFPVGLVLRMPQDSVLDDGWFFDSVYHLNRKGRAVRAGQLVEVLLAKGAQRR